MRITLRDIARRLNLSHATVSFVLNERTDISIPTTTRERVMKAAREMGYRPNRAAQALVRGRTDMVALWVPHLHSPLYSRVIREMVALASDRGYQSLIRIADFDYSGSVTPIELDDTPVDGILAFDCALVPRFDLTQPLPMPVVNLGSYFDQGTDFVGIDLGTGILEAAKHLYEQGCRRIAHLTVYNPNDTLDPRRTAYLQACAELGLQPEIIVSIDATRAGARSKIREHVSTRGVPDGLIVYNDSLAIAAIKGLEDMGYMCPKNVLVVGCDGTEEGEYARPSLTTIAQPVAEVCRRAWQILGTRIEERRHRYVFESRVSALAAWSEKPLAKRGPKPIFEELPEMDIVPQQGDIVKSRLIIRESSVRKPAPAQK